MVGMLLLASGRCASAEPEQPKRNEAVTVVILLPREQTADLLLLCDRLAEALGQTKSIRVVDRTQLDRILQERKTASQPMKAMLAYDLMVRMRVDLLRAAPKIAIELIDLSTGNVVAGKQYARRAKPDKNQLADMAKLCRAAAGKVSRPGSRRLRVRLLGVDNVGHSPRLEPMAAHLVDIIQQTVTRSSGCAIVRHLEAITSKEESLLIHMGLARLAGGRRFLPQADVTMEAEIKETQTVGKTFKQTPLEVRFRLTRRGQKPSKWTTAAGTVAEWEKIVRDTCRQVAAGLGQTEPVPFGDYAAEMVRRRKQAEAELAAAKKEIDIGSVDWVTMHKHSPAGRKIDVHPAYVRIAAAAKLDPTYEEAAYSLAFSSTWSNWVEDSNQSRARAMEECLGYLRRFKWHRKHHSRIFMRACFVANDYFIDLRGEASSARPMTPERLRAMAVLRDILDMLPSKKDIVFQGTSGQSYYCSFTRKAAHLVYCGSTRAGVPLAERRQWLDQYSRRCDEVFGTGQVDLLILQLTYAIDDSDRDRAGKVLNAILARSPTWSSEKLDYLGKQLRRQVVRMNDQRLLGRVDLWLKSEQAGKRAVCFLSNHWPPLYVFPSKWDKTTAVWMSYHDRKWWSAKPILLHNGWLYLVMGSVRWRTSGESSASFPAKGSFVRMQVDEKGRSKGKIEPLKGTPKGLRVLAFAARGNRVFFGTMGEGLYQFNDKTGKWASWDAKKGFPARSVRKIWPLDDKTLLLFGEDSSWPTRRLFTLDLQNDEVKIIRNDGNRSLDISAVWQRNGKLMALLNEGLVTDLLGKATLTDSALTSDGRKVSLKSERFPETAAIGKRRWLKCGRLYEVDEKGRVVRTWRGRTWMERPLWINGPPSDDRTVLPGIPPDFPGNAHLRSRYLAQDESHLFLVGDSQVVCYDPAKDIWYGHLIPGPSIYYVVGAPKGIWIATSRGPAFMETRKFIETATAMGRALTSEQFKRRQQELIEACPPLKRAKFQIAQRDFSAAVPALAAALKKDPDNPELLLWMGFVHDTGCLNKLDEAMKYYTRLAAVTKDVSPPGGPKISARMTALWSQFTILLRQKKWKQAVEVGETFQKEFPRAVWGRRDKVGPRLEMARKQLGKGEK